MTKQILVLIGSMSLSACAHKTVHEYCQENLGRYRDYDQCYGEVSRTGVNVSAGSRFMTGFAKGYNANRAKNIHCTTTGSPGFYSTNCQ